MFQDDIIVTQPSQNKDRVTFNSSFQDEIDNFINKCSVYMARHG